MNKKSEENILAADVLIKSAHYSSSIHCSYYALYQYMMYMLNQRYKCSYDQQRNLAGNASSHIRISREFERKLRSDSPQLCIDVMHTFVALKQQRVSADYSTTRIEKEIAERLREEVNKHLTALKAV